MTTQELYTTLVPIVMKFHEEAEDADTAEVHAANATLNFFMFALAHAVEAEDSELLVELAFVVAGYMSSIRRKRYEPD
jgi:hypothetical protein